jgi:DNA transformation protein
MQMGSLSSLPNIGKITEALLKDAGIETAEDLLHLGSREAFLRIRFKDNTLCLHMLYGLEGAVRGIPDTKLPHDVKEELKAFFYQLS